MSRIHSILIDAEYNLIGLEAEVLREEDAVTLETYYADDVRELGRFAVTYNMPGYLPESDPVYFDCEDDAEQYVRECRLADEDAHDTGYVYDIVDMAQ
jgi:hypothetical protein